MLAYNIWRYMKILAQKSAATSSKPQGFEGLMTNTIRIARLKLLFIAAKVVKNSNTNKVKYSIHDARAPAMMNFLKFLDRNRAKTRPWEENSIWPQRFVLQL